jgi:membrane protein DedA with SNARE-associated domain
MVHVLVDLIARFGYALVFLAVGIESMGVPVPGETGLVIGAVAAGQGKLSPVGVAFAGWLGAVLGDNVGYWIGRRFGRRLFHAPGFRRIYTEERVARAEALFARRHGWLAVFFGRFVALLRIFAGPLAGMHGMPWTRFLVANATGAAVWVAAVVAVGLAAGSQLHLAIRIVSSAGYVGLALVVVLILGVVGTRVVRVMRRRGVL